MEILLTHFHLRQREQAEAWGVYKTHINLDHLCNHLFALPRRPLWTKTKTSFSLFLLGSYFSKRAVKPQPRWVPWQCGMPPLRPRVSISLNLDHSPARERKKNAVSETYSKQCTSFHPRWSISPQYLALCHLSTYSIESMAIHLPYYKYLSHFTKSF